MDFLKQMENTANKSVEYNGAVTENGAIGYATSLDKLVDMNFKVASYRNMSEDEITSDFMAAFNQDPIMTFRWLFFARDVRGGLGERRLFKVCLKKLLQTHSLLRNDLMNICHLIMKFGRGDDLYVIKDSCVDGHYVFAEFVKQTLDKDIYKARLGAKGVSLLAKWLASEKASSEESRRLAKETARAIGMSMKKYRKTLSTLRRYLDVVECKMSANEWGEINYSGVPSKAGLTYSDAFTRHDEDRYKAYLDAVSKGEEKINAGTLYPYEIVSKYMVIELWRPDVRNDLDVTLEEMWKALPNTVKDKRAGSTIVVADGSGSMMSEVCGKTTALDVANSLAIYFAERMEGPFKNKYITFSSKPQFVDLSNCVSLREKLVEALKHDECSTTNIEAVFDLMLKTAVGCGMEQSEMPANVLIVSDMEFNGATDGRVDRSLFDGIRERFEAAGYKLPRLVFWNVNSRTCVVPIQENDAGVALVSGFSQNIAEMVMSGGIDPAQCLVNTLQKERYKQVWEVARSAFGEKEEEERDFWSDIASDVITYF